MLFAELMACAAANIGGGAGTLARPSAPVFAVTRSGADYLITVSALPVSWGDLIAPGDGLGTIGTLEWWNAFDGWQLLADPAATGDYVKPLDASLAGSAVISLRGVSAAGRAGLVATVREEVVTHLGEIVTHNGEPVTVFVGD